MIVVDTGAALALIDRHDAHHDVLRSRFEKAPDHWILPWAILAEVDYLVSTRLGRAPARAFRQDLASGLFSVEWPAGADLTRAVELDEAYADLELGLVDTVVMATAERVGALAIATLDLRDFAAVDLIGQPQLWPRDL